MASSKDVVAGGASVRIGGDDTDFKAVISNAERRMTAFGKMAISLGAQGATFGLSLGAGLVAAGNQFVSTGTKLDQINKQMTGMQAGPELEKLRLEAARLQAIMGGESVESAIKLSKSFTALKDAVSSVIVKVGGALAPAITDTIDYFKKGVDAVGKFVAANRALAPQAAIVVGVIIAAGAATMALGTAFYVTGPIIKLAMIAASIATMAFGVALASVNAVVAVSSAVLKVMTGVATLAAAAYRFLNVTTIAFSVSQAALNLATKITVATLGLLYTAVKAVTLSIALSAVTMSLGAAGFKSLATGIRTARIALLAFNVTSAVTSAISFAGIAVTGAGLVAAFLIWTEAGQNFVSGVVNAFNNLQSTISNVFSGITGEGAAMPSALSTYFSDVSTMASTAFNNVLTTVKNVFNQAKQVFGELLNTARGTFSGISDAIEAGNIELATKVLWAGLQVAFTQGGDALRGLWDSMLIYLEGAWDGVMTNLKMIWDVGIAYMQGAFDKFVTGIRNKWQDISGMLGETIAVNVFGADAESAREENQAQKDRINSGVQEREDKRNAAIANAGDDEGARKREADRQARLARTGQASPELEAQKAALAALVGQAAVEANAARNKMLDEGKKGEELAKATAATMQSPAAQARNSSGAASSIARAVNSQSNVPQQQLDIAKKALAATLIANKELKEFNKNKITFKEVA